MRGGATIAALLAAIGLSAALAGCHQVAQSTAAAKETGRITASDQAAGGAVLVDAIGMPTTGWVVVHAVRNGEPDYSGSIGRLYVSAGPSETLSVPLDAPARPGDEVAVMLHIDTGVAQVFEFAKGAQGTKHDEPIIANGGPVMAMVRLN